MKEISDQFRTPALVRVRFPSRKYHNVMQVCLSILPVPLRKKRIEVVVIQAKRSVHVEVALQDPLLEVIRLLAGSGLSRHLADGSFHGGDALGTRMIVGSER
jgi:hypothetical protein